MKKIIENLQLVTIVFVLCLAGFMSIKALDGKVYAETYGDYTYSINEDGTVTITGITSDVDSSVVIPTTIDGRSVTRIGDDAFYYCKWLTNITIPDSVISIGDSAFAYSSLNSVMIPDSVVNLGQKAFEECDSLVDVKLSNRLSRINDGMFENCKKLRSIEIHYGVEYIGCNAFQYCSGLAEVSLPESVTTIEQYAFDHCSSLTSITIPKNVSTIAGYAFDYCNGLSSIIVEQGNQNFDSRGNCNAIIEKETIWGDSLILGCKNTIILDDVTNIGYRAFIGCDKLNNIAIPDSVESISASAFSGCSGLTSIMIPKSVTSIGNHVFSDCPELSKIVIDSNNPKYDSREDCNAIIEKETNTLIYGCKKTHIPNSVERIEESAFSGCIGLTSITIPKSVTSIGNNVFFDCAKLNKIIVDSNNPKYDSREDCNAIIQKETSTLIYGCKETHIPDSVVSIGESAFSGCSGLTDIVIPDSVVSIGESAFSGCSGLTSIIIPKRVSAIVYHTFENCEGLTDATISNGVTSIEKYAFEGCSKLTSIKIPDSVTDIDDCAFYGCPETMVIYANSGSYVEQWAKERYLLDNGKSKTENVTGVSLNKAYAELSIGDTLQLTTKVSPDSAANKNVVWNSSNKNIAVVNETGLVTAKADGTAYITVKTEDGNKTASCTVTVKKGETVKTSSIKPAKVTGLKVKAKGSGKISITWKKAKNASKYNVQIAAKKNFKTGKKTKTLNAKQLTCKKLKKGKIYYVRVRAYNAKSKKYGNWSSIKKVKVK